MLGMQEVRAYLLSLNVIKYKFNDSEFYRRSNFVYRMCSHYGYLSHDKVINMFENC